MNKKISLEKIGNNIHIAKAISINKKYFSPISNTKNIFNIYMFWQSYCDDKEMKGGENYMFTLLKIVASNPVTILIALGSLGFLTGVDGAGVLLLTGIILQFAWLGRFYI